MTDHSTSLWNIILIRPANTAALIIPRQLGAEVSGLLF